MSSGNGGTVQIRVYSQDKISLINGTKWLNSHRQDKKVFTIADTVQKMIEENRRMKQRINYLEIKGMQKLSTVF